MPMVSAQASQIAMIRLGSYRRWGTEEAHLGAGGGGGAREGEMRFKSCKGAIVSQCASPAKACASPQGFCWLPLHYEV